VFGGLLFSAMHGLLVTSSILVELQVRCLSSVITYIWCTVDSFMTHFSSLFRSAIIMNDDTVQLVVIGLVALSYISTGLCYGYRTTWFSLLEYTFNEYR